jgi:hypothetical protein
MPSTPTISAACTSASQPDELGDVQGDVLKRAALAHGLADDGDGLLHGQRVQRHAKEANRVARDSDHSADREATG